MVLVGLHVAGQEGSGGYSYPQVCYAEELNGCLKCPKSVCGSQIRLKKWWYPIPVPVAPKKVFVWIIFPFYKYFRLHKTGSEWFAVLKLDITFEFPEICNNNLAILFRMLSFVIV